MKYNTRNSKDIDVHMFLHLIHSSFNHICPQYPFSYFIKENYNKKLQFPAN